MTFESVDFPAPLAPQEAVDLALAQLEIGTGQRPRSRKALGDALREKQGWLCRPVERRCHAEP